MIACTNSASGRAPSMLPVSFTMVRGTARIWYRCARYGNSVISTMSAVMNSFSTATCCASRTAAGQCGQVGVLNTWMWVGWVIPVKAVLLSGVRSVLPLDTVRMAARKGANSYPSGMP